MPRGLRSDPRGHHLDTGAQSIPLASVPAGSTAATTRRYRCDDCNKTYAQQRGRRRHWKDIHDPSPRPFVCSKCLRKGKRKEYSRKDHYESHMDRCHRYPRERAPRLSTNPSPSATHLDGTYSGPSLHSSTHNTRQSSLSRSRSNASSSSSSISSTSSSEVQGPRKRQRHPHPKIELSRAKRQKGPTPGASSTQASSSSSTSISSASLSSPSSNQTVPAPPIWPRIPTGATGQHASKDTHHYGEPKPLPEDRQRILYPGRARVQPNTEISTAEANRGKGKAPKARQLHHSPSGLVKGANRRKATLDKDAINRLEQQAGDEPGPSGPKSSHMMENYEKQEPSEEPWNHQTSAGKRPTNQTKRGRDGR